MTTLALNISLEDLLKSLSILSNQEKKEIHSFLESELSRDEVNEPVETYRLSEKNSGQRLVIKRRGSGMEGFVKSSMTNSQKLRDDYNSCEDSTCRQAIAVRLRHQLCELKIVCFSFLRGKVLLEQVE